MAIIRNMGKCRKCGSVIESVHVHDFVTCSCGACSVDGGHSYLRRVGNPCDFEELSICSEDPSEELPDEQN